jgi:two-component system, OmpR family, response regulator
MQGKEAPAAASLRGGRPVQSSPQPKEKEEAVPPAVVVADDDWATRMLVAINLEPDGYEVRSASSAREIEDALADGRVRLVLLDIRMGGDNGIEIARRLGTERPDVAIVFLTGARYLLTAAENDLAHELIEKPFTIGRLRATVARLCGLKPANAPSPLIAIPSRTET